LGGGGLIRGYMIWYGVNRRYGIWLEYLCRSVVGTDTMECTMVISVRANGTAKPGARVTRGSKFPDPTRPDPTRKPIHNGKSCRTNNELNVCLVASPAMGHWGTCPLRFQQFNFSSLWSRPKAEIQILCSLRDQLVQMSTTRIRSVLH